MGKSSPAPPAAPDYAAAATAQGNANVNSATAGASLSNPNIISPYGNQSVSYANTGPNGDAQPTVTQTLTPAAQQTLDAQQQAQLGLANLGVQGTQSAAGILGTPFNPNTPPVQTSLSPAGALQGGPTAGALNYGSGAGPSAQNALDLSGVAKQDVNAGMTGQNAILSRLEPQLQQTEAATAQRLANQGITPGSEAYNNEMRVQGQNRNDAEQQAALQGISLDQSANNQGFNQAATQAGLYNSALGQNFTQGQQAATLNNTAQGENFSQGTSNAQLANQNQGAAFNQNLQAGEFANTAIGQQLAQALQLRSQPLNEITALESGSQIQNPQFQQYQGQNVAAAPVFQAAQQQQQDALTQYGIQANQAATNNAGLYSGLGSIASLAALSDVRLKSNIVKVGDDPRGFGVYEYDILGHRERGVLAQEVQPILPHAVLVHPSGYLMVDYGVING